MKKLILGSVVLSCFSLSVILFLFSACQKNSDTNSSSSSTIGAKDIYVAGMEVSGQNFVPVYWKNGVKTQLSNTFCYTYDIFVSGTDVYVVGFEGLSVHYPVVWKNGVKTQLSSRPGEAESVFVSGADVYICGTEYLSSTNSGQTVACLWKNGVKTELGLGTNSSARSVFVIGYDIYVAGMSSSKAVFWKNGQTDLFFGGPITSGSTSIFVTNTDLFVLGWETIASNSNNKIPVLLRKTFNSPTNLFSRTPLSTISSNGSIPASSIFVAGTDQYICGFEGGACYWKNGTRTQLSTNTDSYASEVSVSGSDVYISGNGNNNTAGYWKNGTWVELSSAKGSYSEAIVVQ